MARMSVDDMLGRDPRITALAQQLSINRYEVVGHLIVDVWPICYDQRTALISERLIDVAVGVPGFAQAMIECELATRDRGGKVRVRGASERIEYLDHKRKAGRQGGLTSAESRNKNSSKNPPVLKQGGSTPQARGNPSASASASASASVPDPPPVPDLPDPPDASAPGSGEAANQERSETTRLKALRIPDRAWKAADYLRDLVLREDPAAAVGRQPWDPDTQTGWRLGWADGIRLMVERDKRTYEQIAETMHWLFGSQPPGPRFIVQSVDSLREKWDRIQAVRRNKAAERQQPQMRIASIPVAEGARKVNAQ